MTKIVNIADYGDPSIFAENDLLLGDKAGKWLVVSDGVLVGRYIERADAEDHAASLSSPHDEYKNMTLSEMNRELDKLIADTEQFLRKTKNE